MMKKFLTLKEAADYLGIAEDELKKNVDKNKLPSYKIGGIYTRFKLDDLDYYRQRSHGKYDRSHSNPGAFADKIKDFFYFNDFYIFSLIVIAAILFLIFK